LFKNFLGARIVGEGRRRAKQNEGEKGKKFAHAGIHMSRAESSTKSGGKPLFLTCSGYLA
jgi:hypothetical protein